MSAPLLDIRGLSVSFATRRGPFQAVDGVDLSVAPNELLAIVGESGSGKSVAMLAIMGLLPWTATVTAEHMVFDGQDLLTLTPRQRRGLFRPPWSLRAQPPKGVQAVSGRPRNGLIGKDVAMVFQEPMSSLNPCFTVGWQISEALAQHTPLGRRERQARVIALLEQVGIPDPVRRARAFPHQLSGGMCQRVMIAMALACKPRLLIADEPTTALDVTIQAQIMDLLQTLRRDTGMALVLITHDLGVVAEAADRVMVQYAGRVVETQPAATLFTHPHHPYTHALLAALPERATGARLEAIDGVVPGQSDRPAGCLFAPRCSWANAHCHAVKPLPADAALGRALCHTPLDDAGKPIALNLENAA